MRHGELDLGMGEEIAVPVGVAVPSALGRDQDELPRLDDRRGQDCRVFATTASSNGVQLNDGHAEGRPPDMAPASAKHTPVHFVQGFESKIGEERTLSHLLTVSSALSQLRHAV
jgi:hypothetical protein